MRDSTTNSLNSSAANMSQEITASSSNSALADAMSLLVAWNLPQLCEKFREQEVCTNALQCLTENDIIQLVPKIGPRAIFSTHLKEWLSQKQSIAQVASAQQQHQEQQRSQQRQQQQQPAQNGDHSCTDLLGAVKLEIRESEVNWLDNSDVDEVETPMEVTPVITTTTTTTTTRATTAAAAVAASERSNSPYATDDVEHVEQANVQANSGVNSATNLQVNNANAQVFVNVRDILLNNFYGIKAIEYYENHNTLDAVQRKKIVEIIITTVMEQHVVMSSQCFTDLAQQVISLFPNEALETYYTPRKGMTCPKGALYNKYLNMGKAMRRSGLLEYRVGRRAVRHYPPYHK